MIGLLFMVVLVSVVYEVLIVAIVVVGTRLRNSAERGREGAVGLARGPTPQPVATMVAGSQGIVLLRASDREREIAAERIAEAMGEGRLGLDEGVERLDAAHRARHRSELERLVADLPHPAPPTERSAGGDRGGTLPAAALVAVAAAVVAQVIAGTWVLWPVAVALLVPPVRRRSR